jgi:signal transduction histidine kinase
MFSGLFFFLKPVIDIYAYVISSAFKVTSYCLFYRAAVETSLKEPYDSLLYKLKDSNNNLEKTIKNLQDEITVHMHTEDNLEKAVEKERVKNDLFVNISHELRTPINIINSTLQLVELYEKNQNDVEAYKKFKEYLKPMEQNCNRLSRLISNLIDMTKYDNCKLKLNMENCNIVDVVENITLSVVTYANLKDIEIIFDTDVEEKILSCDTYMMERVMLNLLSNAIKFTPKGGKILVNIFDKGNTVLIKVADNGIGISEDKIPTIFERFSQSGNDKEIESEGSGIGLSLVKAIVEMHNGTISVKSSKNKGTEFSIELPVKVIGDGKIECHEFNLIRNMNRIDIEMSDIE